MDRKVFGKVMLSLLLRNQYDLNEVLGCKQQSSILVTDCEIPLEIECEHMSKIMHVMCGQVKHVHSAHGKCGFGKFCGVICESHVNPNAEHPRLLCETYGITPCETHQKYDQPALTDYLTKTHVFNPLY